MTKNSLCFGMQSGGVATQNALHTFIDLLQSSILNNRSYVQQCPQSPLLNVLLFSFLIRILFSVDELILAMMTLKDDRHEL